MRSGAGTDGSAIPHRLTVNLVSSLGEYIDYENGKKEMKNKDMSILELCVDATPEQPDIFEC